MTNKNEEFYKLTFSQREGKAPLPEPMKLESVPQRFRNLVWRAIGTEIEHLTDRLYGGYFESVGIPKIIESYKFDVEQRRHDEIPNSIPKNDRSFTKKIVIDGEFHEIITIVEYILRHEQCSDKLKASLEEAFDKSPIAYFVKSVNGKPTVFPRINREAGEATKKAMETIQDGGMESANVHLKKAAEHINMREYGGSIRESIHAVESVARNLSKSKNSLTPALKTLEKEGLLNRVLRIAFEKLYGYTNSEQGIRHSLLDRDNADVGLEEAVFMFGACASFAAYLVHKQQQCEE